MALKPRVCHAVVLHVLVDRRGIPLWHWHLVVGGGGKTQIQTTHIPTGTFPRSPSLSVQFRNLERYIIFFRARGYLTYYSIDLLKGRNVPPRIPYDLPGETGLQ